MPTLRSLAATLVLLTGFGVSLLAQEAASVLPRPDRITTAAPVPKKSPMNAASMRAGEGYVRVVYSQPMLRGRQMLGDQVPYGQLWRLGANEATELFATRDLTVGDRVLPAGAYSVFAIPEAEAWTLVFSRDLGQWGAYSYRQERDALRVRVPVEQIDNPYEAFTIFFADGELVMAWGTTRAAVPVRFGAAEE